MTTFDSNKRPPVVSTLLVVPLLLCILWVLFRSPLITESIYIDAGTCRVRSVHRIAVFTFKQRITETDLSALNKQWGERAERIKKLVDSVPGVTTEIKIPEDGNRYPTVSVTWDEDAWKFTVADCDRKLRDGEPRIEVLTASNPSLLA